MDNSSTPRPPGFSCPIPIAQYPQVLLAHGGGRRLMQQLIQRMFLPSFQHPALLAQADGAVRDRRQQGQGQSLPDDRRISF